MFFSTVQVSSVSNLELIKWSVKIRKLLNKNSKYSVHNSNWGEEGSAGFPRVEVEVD